MSQSIGNENLTDCLATIGDAGLDIAAKNLHGIPVLGTILSIVRAGYDVKHELEFRNIIKFLEGVGQTPAEKRTAFTEKLKVNGKTEEFGQNILLILTRLDDVSKPKIIGKIIAAHIDGHIDYEKAMRLAAIIDRCYASDFAYLKNFKAGTQGKGDDIAAMLCAAGLLANKGIDGGTFSDPQSGGIIYDLNIYAELLLKYGL